MTRSPPRGKLNLADALLGHVSVSGDGLEHLHRHLHFSGTFYDEQLTSYPCPAPTVYVPILSHQLKRKAPRRTLNSLGIHMEWADRY